MKFLKKGLWSKVKYTSKLGNNFTTSRIYWLQLWMSFFFPYLKSFPKRLSRKGMVNAYFHQKWLTVLFPHNLANITYYILTNRNLTVGLLWMFVSIPLINTKLNIFAHAYKLFMLVLLWIPNLSFLLIFIYCLYTYGFIF